MNAILESAVSDFLKKANNRGQQGSIFTLEDITNANEILKGLIPHWYIELVTRFPIAGIEFRWQEFPSEEGFDGLSSIFWSDFANLIDESVKLYPGVDVIKSGYFNVASDNDGTGDPYFIKANEGDDPPLYHICHELFANSELVICGYTAQVVNKRLSDVFREAIFS